MSGLIDQLRAEYYPDQSARDLTLQVGQWAEAGNRKDLFSDHPDFAKEYYAIKDDIARAKRPGLGEEIVGGFQSGMHELGATGLALGALAAHGAQAIGVPGAEPVRNNLVRLMQEQQAEAAETPPSVPSFTDISAEHPLEDTTRYALRALGEQGPGLATAALQAVGGAVAGAAVGSVEPGGGTVVGGVAGGLLGLAERRLAQKAVSRLLEKGITDVTLEQAAKAIPREAVMAEAKRLGAEYGAQAALAAGAVSQSTGDLYAQNPDAPGAAILGGIPAGLIAVLPQAYVASRFFPAEEAVTEVAAKEANGYFQRFVKEAAKTVPLMGGTMPAMTMVQIAAAKYGRGEDPASFTAEDYKQALNAGIIGGITAVPLAAAGAGPKRVASSGPRLEETVIDRLPFRPGEQPSAEAGPLEFGSGSEIADADLALRPRPPLVQNPTGGLNEPIIPDAEFDVRDFAREQQLLRGPAAASAQVFLANERNPAMGLYEVEPGGARAVLPKPVEKAVAAVDDAIAEFERRVLPPAPALELPAASPPPTPAETEHLAPPPSNVVQHAPLANLIGTKVQYEGYEGTLVRDRDGNFMVQPEVTQGSTPRWIEVEGSGKDPAKLSSEVGLMPMEPANVIKPAPGVEIPGRLANARPESKVPLGDMFPSDLVPRADLNPAIAEQPGSILSTQNRNATQTRVSEQNREQQYQPTVSRGVSPETGRGDRTQRGGPLEPASAAGERDTAQAEFVGEQHLGSGLPAVEMWRLKEDIPGHRKGDVVSRETLAAAGYEVPLRAEESPTLKLPFKDAGYDTHEAFLSDYEKRGLHEVYETADEFLRRIYCAR